MMRLKSRYKKKKKKQTQACMATSQSAYKEDEHTEIQILAYLGMLELDKSLLIIANSQLKVVVVARPFLNYFQNLQQGMMTDTHSHAQNVID